MSVANAETSLLAPGRRSAMEWARWRQVAVAASGCAIVGGIYNYGLFGAPISSTLGLTSSQSTTVLTIGWAPILNIPAGFLLDKLGPRTVNALCFTLITIGFLMMTIAYAKAESDPEVWGKQTTLNDAGKSITVSAPSWKVAYMTIAYSFCTWAGASLDVGILLPNLGVFGGARGTIVMLQKTYMGLGGAVFSLMFVGFFDADEGASKTARFCGLCTALSAFVGVMCVWGIRDSGSNAPGGAQRKLVEEEMAAAGEERPEDLHARVSPQGAAAMWQPEPATRASMHFWRTATPPAFAAFTGYGLLFASLVVLLTGSTAHNVLSSKKQSMPDGVMPFLAALALLCLAGFWVLPFIAAWRSKDLPSIEQDLKADDAVAEKAIGGTEPVEAAKPQELADEDDEQGMCGGEPGYYVDPSTGWAQYDDTIPNTLRTATFYLLWVAFGICWGGGSSGLGILTGLYKSTLNSCEEYNSATNAILSAMSGLGSALGRISIGILERVFCRPRHIIEESEEDKARNVVVRAAVAAFRRVACVATRDTPTVGEPQLPPMMHTTALMPLAPILMCVGYALFAIAPSLKNTPEYVAVPYLIHGIGYGCGWGCSILVIATLYAPRRSGRMFGVLSTGGLVLTPTAIRGLIAPLFSAAKAKQDTECCLGFTCYGPATITLSCCMVLSTTLIIITHMIWRRENNLHGRKKLME